MRPHVVLLVVDAHVARTGHRDVGKKPSAVADPGRVHVQHDELDQLRRVGQRGKRRPPEHRRRQIARLQGERVDKLHRVTHFGAHNQLGQVTHGLGEFLWQHNKVVFTNRHDLHGKRELVLRRARMNVLTDQLLGLFRLDRNHAVEEIDHLGCVVSLRIIEIKTVLGLFDRNGIHVCVVFKNELFQVQECSLMLDFLPDLNGSTPCIDRVRLGTVGTLHSNNHVLHLETLLDDGVGESLALDRQFDPNSTGMRFGPDKRRIYKPDFVETFQSAQTQSQ
ncbi:hypothetical protein OGAPHI_001516 [Ogataea philodendri]|uniref:Uncharacterized protein n=1 Tax=Ogataea philodendri TaxID=1378263 RepID=A0A9P8T8N4_9ASCO|nr:uncharacterized protein OGAPHI_001516 [Ogataea philodendri]KAH3669395.1 hypothetical protein OGAPHI_001516 [Ogataea philodendri]